MPKHVIAKMSSADQPDAARCATHHRPSAETISDIARLTPMRGRELIEAFRLAFGQTGFCTDEALVFFAMRACAEDDKRTINGLFDILIARCQRFFRGQMKGMRSADERMDAQAIVLEQLSKAIIEGKEKNGFMIRRFRLWLQKRTYSAIEKVANRRRKEALFDDCVTSDDEDESRIVLVREHALSPEEILLINDGLAVLPQDLRQLYILRYYQDWRVGDDRTAADPGDPTLADLYGVSATAIKKRLAKAEKLLAEYRKDPA